MITVKKAMEAAWYLIDRRVCMGIRRVGLDSRYAVMRRGEKENDIKS